MKAKQREVLPGMFSEAQAHRPVVRTSVLAYQAHGGFKGRKKAIFNELLSLPPWTEAPPTSAELAQFMHWELGDVPLEWTARLLFVRRGLSDLLACGAVEHGPSRPCKVTGETCVTWRPVAR